jgi:hypothetical protein
MMADRVLIVGDLVVDEAWLVGRPATEERFAAHYDVLPRNIIDPKRNAGVAGGVGTVARALSTSDIHSTVMTGWGSDVSPKALVPADEYPDRIEWVPVAQSDYTPRITRVYIPDAKGKAKLTGRYDRDTFEKLKYIDSVWPIDVALVVAGEYPPTRDGASVLDLDEVVTQVNQFDGRVPILLRSTRRSIIERIKWSVLSLNIHHLTRVLGLRRLEGSLLREVDGVTIYHPSLIRAIESLATGFLSVANSPHRYVVLNLEEHGALVLDREKISPLVLGGSTSRKPGIGATDVLLAQLARGLGKPAVVAALKEADPGPSRDAVIQACEEAIRYSIAFSAQSLNLDQKAGWRAPALSVTPKAAIAVERRQDSGLVNEVKSTDRSTQYHSILDDGIRLSRASWYLPDYITVDPGFGEEVVRLTRQSREYLRAPGKRPFVAALCGDPGSGKSTLAKKIGKALECEFVEGNAAQWSSADDLFALCERVRSLHVREKACLVFIDEVDSLVGGEELYGKLLAPLWDGAYFIGGDERTMGTPTIFLLAGSTADWSKGEVLISRGADHSGSSAKPRGRFWLPRPKIRPSSKLPDLVSRLSAKPLTIPGLSVRQADVVYLAAWHFLDQNPRVTQIEKGVLRLFADSPEFRHGVRSISRMVDLFKPLSDDTIVRTSDIGDRQGELELQLREIPTGWENMNEPVTVQL